MPNEIKSFDGREALDEFLKAALPRANFVTRTSYKQFAASHRNSNVILLPKKYKASSKIIEAQTFVCTDVNALEQLHSQLEVLSKEFEKSLPADSAGLVIPEASAFTLVDRYRAKHRLCTSAIPDPSLDAGHAKRGRPSVEKHLRCHVGVSGETERRQFLQDRQRQQVTPYASRSVSAGCVAGACCAQCTHATLTLRQCKRCRHRFRFSSLLTLCGCALCPHLKYGIQLD